LEKLKWLSIRELQLKFENPQRLFVQKGSWQKNQLGRRQARSALGASRGFRLEIASESEIATLCFHKMSSQATIYIRGEEDRKAGQKGLEGGER